LETIEDIEDDSKTKPLNKVASRTSGPVPFTIKKNMEKLKGKYKSKPGAIADEKEPTKTRKPDYVPVETQPVDIKIAGGNVMIGNSRNSSRSI